MTQLQLEDRAIEDSTPTVTDQAKAQGFECQYYHFGKLEGDGSDYFNPSIVERPDGKWLLVRRAEPHPQGFMYGQNALWAFMLDETGTVPKMGKKLHWPVDEPSQQFEDPRGFYYPRINQTLIGACTFVWYQHQRWTGPHQCFGAFDHEWNCVKMHYPVIGGNPPGMERIEKHENYEKNWLWFLNNDKLHLLYKAKPWLIFQFGETWNEPKAWKLDNGITWVYGDIRGGTTPIQVGDYYFTFHHSSLPWQSKYRRYYAGCLAFEAVPPFYPKFVTKEPILIGSQNDIWAEGKPLVVFPCGAIFNEGNWLVSLGVNDMRAAWLKLSHKSLLAKMSPIGDVQPIFTESGLSKRELWKQKLRENIAKARAAKAAKKELAIANPNGEVRFRKRRMKRKVVKKHGKLYQGSDQTPRRVTSRIGSTAGKENTGIEDSSSS
jgi:predicted GH43/DUF377 family glycosyl hydrolase